MKIWEATLDGRYECVVTRKDGDRGVLTVVDVTTEKELLRKEVGLSYGAAYGPDVGDVADWEKLIEAAI